MVSTRIRAAAVLLLAGAVAGLALAVPNPSPEDTIKDRKGFIPYRKHQALPGTVVGVLLYDAQPVLSTEGRSGPADQLCFATGGGSYRWVYVPVKEKPGIGTLQIPVGGKGERKAFPNLSMASPATVKQWDVTEKYSLVEVEVNAGLGSPAEDAFVATGMKVLDGSKEYPIKVAETIGALRLKYDSFLQDKDEAISTGMRDAQKAAVGEQKPTGPREKTTLMFITWLPDAQQLRVHFKTRITDGVFQRGFGVRPVDPFPLPPRPIKKPMPDVLPPVPPVNKDKGEPDFNADVPAVKPAPPAPAVQPVPPGVPPPPREPVEGALFGTKFGVELGAAYVVSKTGKVEQTLTLPLETFKEVLPPPPAIRRPPFELPPPPLPVNPPPAPKPVER